MRRELCCLAPASPPRLQLRQGPVPEPRRGEVRLRVEASAVNPIDLKRAAGYGQRLLGLKGAGRFPLVLGNDVVGRIEAVGPGVSVWAPGQRVFGLLPTGRRGGAHASQVVVPQQLLQAAPEAADAADLAVLPYSFTTVWLAVAATGLSPDRAAGVCWCMARPAAWGAWPCRGWPAGAVRSPPSAPPAPPRPAVRWARSRRSSGDPGCWRHCPRTSMWS